MEARYRLPHRRRPPHRRPATGVHPAVRRARRLDADDHDQQRGVRERHRGHGLRAVLRRGLARRRARRRHRGRRARGAVLGRGHGHRHRRHARSRAPRIEVWEADADGLYDVQYGDDRVAARGHLHTDDRRPLPLLGGDPHAVPDPRRRARRRAPAAPPAAPRCAPRTSTSWSWPTGYRTLVTHVFPRGDAYLDSDSVFGVRDSLIVDVHHQLPATPTPDGREVAGPWARIAFDLVLAPAP